MHIPGGPPHSAPSGTTDPLAPFDAFRQHVAALAERRLRIFGGGGIGVSAGGLNTGTRSPASERAGEQVSRGAAPATAGNLISAGMRTATFGPGSLVTGMLGALTRQQGIDTGPFGGLFGSYEGFVNAPDAIVKAVEQGTMHPATAFGIMDRIANAALTRMGMHHPPSGAYGGRKTTARGFSSLGGLFGNRGGVVGGGGRRAGGGAGAYGGGQKTSGGALGGAGGV